MAQTPEGRVKRMVKKALDHLGPDCWRFMPVQNGFGSVALDFLLSVRGRFVAIETKAPGKKLTALQEQTKAAIEAAGGLVFVVWDETSLQLAMKIILALEFDKRVKDNNVDGLGAYREGSGDHQSFFAVQHRSPEAERAEREYEEAQQSGKAPDPAASGDHGAPGTSPD